MANNITNLIYKREICRHDKETTWYAIRLLEDMYARESYYDHDNLFLLHMQLKSLITKCPHIRNTVIKKITEWQEELRSDEIVTKSQVFLVKYITEYVSEEELEELNRLVDDIKQYSN